MHEDTHRELPPDTSWDVGRVVAGRYRLRSAVGSGGMGVVWRATDLRLDRVVALKQLRLPAGLPPEDAARARQRVFREARIAARLQHPHAVTVYDVTVDDHGQPVLVLEYLPSQTLAVALAEHGTLPAARAAHIGAAVASALAAAHAAGIVHRDVKPANILLATPATDDNRGGGAGDGADTVKITDFGISHATGDVTVTSTGLLAGTPAFLSPEAARGEPATAASDVFSLGATLYAAVVGTPPFGEADNPVAQLHRVAAGHAPAPRHAGPLTRPLTSMLRDDPAARPTMAQVAATLGAIASGRPPTGEQQAVPADAKPPSTPAPTRLDLHPATATPLATAPAAPPVLARRRVTRLGLLAAGLLTLLTLTLLMIARNDDGASSAAPPSTVPSRPTSAPAAVDPVLLQNVVIDYYTLLPNHPDEAWTLLGPAMRNQNREQYEKFWDEVKNLRLRTTPQVSGDTVVVEIEYTRESRGRVQETHRHDLLVHDGTPLINSDHVLATRTIQGDESDNDERDSDDDEKKEDKKKKEDGEGN